VNDSLPDTNLDTPWNTRAYFISGSIPLFFLGPRDDPSLGFAVVTCIFSLTFLYPCSKMSFHWFFRTAFSVRLPVFTGFYFPPLCFCEFNAAKKQPVCRDCIKPRLKFWFSFSPISLVTSCFRLGPSSSASKIRDDGNVVSAAAVSLRHSEHCPGVLLSSAPSRFVLPI